jgi:FixJ family two-component response regulator
MSYDPIVFIVDDDQSYRESLVAFISSMKLKSRVFNDGQEYLNQFDPHVPGILILDIRMPNFGGFAILEQLAKQPLCLPSIILTGFADVSTAVRAMQLGAFDFLQKTISHSELREVIERAIVLDAEKRREFSQRLAVQARLARLSRPERDVLDMVIAGCPNKVIASKLGVSRRTVEDRRARMMEKVEVDSLPKLVRFAIDADLRSKT